MIASHQGPNTFVLGAINSTGLAGKHGVLAQLPPGAYIASETHLTSRAVQTFNSGLSMAQSPFKLVPGAPVPFRGDSVLAGTHSGIGVVSSGPIRPASQAWSPAVWQTARIQVAHVYQDPTWLLIGGVYGYATGPPARTHHLLEALSTRVICEGSGPRCFGGDFNLQPDKLPLWETWKQMGFVEVQDLWATRSAQLPLATCKKTTRKDFLLLSWELAQLVTKVEVREDFFSDHAVLMAHLSFPAETIPRPVWRKCRQRPRDPGNLAFPPATEAETRSIRDAPTSSSKYRAIWQVYERRYSDALVAARKPRLAKHEQGRAATFEVVVQKGSHAPLRKGRQGDPEPHFFGQSIQHAHWFRQLRRLQSLLHNVRKAMHSQEAVIRRADTWHAIISAPGFFRGFVSWWASRPCKLAHAPNAISPGLPTLQALESICLCFEANFREFEKGLLRDRKVLAKTRRLLDPNVAFKDVQARKACPVTSLVEGPSAMVEQVCPEEVAVEVEPAQWTDGSTVFIGPQSAAVLHAEPDKLWLDHLPSGAKVGDRAHQTTLLGSLPALFAAFAEEWSQRWHRHNSPSPDRWQEALQYISLVLPAAEPMLLEPLTPEMWQRAVMSKPPRSASGPDARWRLSPGPATASS